LVSYDNVAVAKKAAFVQQMKLGSMMWWESSADKTGNNCLIQNVTEIVGVDNDPGLDYSPNQLAYPNNIDENLRAGIPESSSVCSLQTPSLLPAPYRLRSRFRQ
jgi:chitinase